MNTKILSLLLSLFLALQGVESNNNIGGFKRLESAVNGWSQTVCYLLFSPSILCAHFPKLDHHHGSTEHEAEEAQENDVIVAGVEEESSFDHGTKPIEQPVRQGLRH